MDLPEYSPIYDAVIRSRSPDNNRPSPKPFRHRQCPGSRDRERVTEERLMSGRAYEDERRQQPDVPTTTASTTRSPTSGPGVATANSHPSRPTSPRQRQEQESCARGVELPPLPPPNRSTFSPPSTTRLAGVSAILNPTSTEVPSQGRRRKASDLDSLGFSQPLPPLAIGSQPSADPARGIASPTNVYGGSAERQGRRVLTPRSPSLHRTMSLGHLHPTPVTTGPQ